MSTDDAPPAGYRDPQPGYVWRWVPSSSLPSNRWQLLDPRPNPRRGCRWGAGHGSRACRAAAVAELERGTRAHHRWAYCADHLYGQRIRGDELQTCVLRPIEGDA